MSLYARSENWYWFWIGLEQPCVTNPSRHLADITMQHGSQSPRIPDSELATRIALVREMTEAARAGAICWHVRDRRLRSLFCVTEASRAFDSTRPCHGP
jgi:hypothetical protein